MSAKEVLFICAAANVCYDACHHKKPHKFDNVSCRIACKAQCPSCVCVPYNADWDE